MKKFSRDSKIFIGEVKIVMKKFGPNFFEYLIFLNVENTFESFKTNIPPEINFGSGSFP